MNGTDPIHIAPEYWCGKGKMRLLRADKYALNPGKYYFKCSQVLSHYESFVWCDCLGIAKESASSSSVLRQHASTPIVEPASEYSQSHRPPNLMSEGVRNRISSDSNRSVIGTPELGHTSEGSEKISPYVHVAFALIILGIVMGMHLSCA